MAAELASNSAACPCLRSFWSVEFVEERLPAVWVEGCLPFAKGVLSLPTDWSLVVVTRLGGPERKHFMLTKMPPDGLACCTKYSPAGYRTVDRLAQLVEHRTPG